MQKRRSRVCGRSYFYKADSAVSWIHRYDVELAKAFAKVPSQNLITFSLQLLANKTFRFMALFDLFSRHLSDYEQK